MRLDQVWSIKEGSPEEGTFKLSPEKEAGKKEKLSR